MTRLGLAAYLRQYQIFGCVYIPASMTVAKMVSRELRQRGAPHFKPEPLKEFGYYIGPPRRAKAV